ncbi:Metallo-dependent phosphatase [Sistotremastrum suecicum HHB10207 ss-3]|uniref:Metallo-dependent phosphatase n=1 Tax=Sistotremastrum suecicum HHB10207 ss-3 TaxID=1314776 RepID=A0A166FTB3_9AGAM|nr:Metallo-dependent phosphatase [Sistotremastrum suecicum HHB10207 ss-3]
MSLIIPLERPISTDTVSVYTSYNIDNPPAHPGPDFTRIICISDTHAESFPVPDGDVLIHGGDLTDLGYFDELKTTMDWICAMPHRRKLVIAGNHDLPLDEETYHRNWAKLAMGKPESTSKALDLMTGTQARNAGVVYLNQSSVRLQFKPDGRHWNIFGSPASPGSGSAFSYKRGEDAKNLHSAIPEETDILITHTPPYNMLDDVQYAGRVVHPGCKDLWERVQDVRPRVHVFGHIHLPHGVLLHQWPGSTPDTAQYQETLFINAANQPIGAGVGQLQEDMRERGIELKTGSYPFQPVIVDIRDIP